MNYEKNGRVIELAEWFVGITGIIYVTGFLVAMTFADYMGAREVISEFLRAKYLHVGILGVALPVIVIGAVYAIIELNSPGMMPAGAKLHGSSVILVFNLLFAFYTFVLFTPTGFLRASPYLILTIFGVTFAGLIAVQMAGCADDYDFVHIRTAVFFDSIDFFVYDLPEHTCQSRRR